METDLTAYEVICFFYAVLFFLHFKPRVGFLVSFDKLNLEGMYKLDMYNANQSTDTKKGKKKALKKPKKTKKKSKKDKKKKSKKGSDDEESFHESTSSGEDEDESNDDNGSRSSTGTTDS